MLGPEKGDDKVACVLNRTIKWTEDGIEVSGDKRHVQIIIEQLGLESESTKGVNTPGVDSPAGEAEELDEASKTMYRATVAMMNYMAQDRSDIQ